MHDTGAGLGPWPFPTQCLLCHLSFCYSQKCAGEKTYRTLAYHVFQKDLNYLTR